MRASFTSKSGSEISGKGIFSKFCGTVFWSFRIINQWKYQAPKNANKKQTISQKNEWFETKEIGETWKRRESGIIKRENDEVLSRIGKKIENPNLTGKSTELRKQGYTERRKGASSQSSDWPHSFL